MILDVILVCNPCIATGVDLTNLLIATSLRLATRIRQESAVSVPLLDSLANTRC